MQGEVIRSFYPSLQFHEEYNRDPIVKSDSDCPCELDDTQKELYLFQDRWCNQTCQCSEPWISTEKNRYECKGFVACVMNGVPSDPDLRDSETAQRTENQEEYPVITQAGGECSIDKENIIPDDLSQPYYKYYTFDNKKYTAYCDSWWKDTEENKLYCGDQCAVFRNATSLPSGCDWNPGFP